MMSRKDDLKFEELRGPDVDKFIEANNHTNSEGMIRIWPSGCAMPKIYRENAERIRNFEVRPDDVWIVTFPKCGKN
ncbi:hypothetical protein C0J52_08335 [Blattella germanica]|nr:hypothetical protein C0J52_08335 [Blattella germanica]